MILEAFGVLAVVSPVWRVTVPVQRFTRTDGLCWDAADTVLTGADPAECIATALGRTNRRRPDALT